MWYNWQTEHHITVYWGITLQETNIKKYPVILHNNNYEVLQSIILPLNTKFFYNIYFITLDLIQQLTARIPLPLIASRIYKS